MGKINNLEDLRKGIKEISKDLDAYTFGMSIEEANEFLDGHLDVFSNNK